ncbi:hypothetical protein RRG08_058936 [Elysia crispata]|uniref:Uncharacterized protein n=1 Tax=Elysia crispata TaxID=231223 RepID=A0AAE0XRV9_9GAST|nr:hypothetical protein RRG08_058936 [Elysia crispata]
MNRRPEFASHTSVSASHTSVSASHTSVSASHTSVSASHISVSASHTSVSASHTCSGTNQRSAFQNSTARTARLSGVGGQIARDRRVSSANLYTAVSARFVSGPHQTETLMTFPRRFKTCLVQPALPRDLLTDACSQRNSQRLSRGGSVMQEILLLS